jgi:hypothetical protein
VGRKVTDHWIAATGTGGKPSDPRPARFAAGVPKASQAALQVCPLTMGFDPDGECGSPCRPTGSEPQTTDQDDGQFDLNQQEAN